MLSIHSLFKKRTEKQYVGYVRNPNKPKKFDKLLAKTCAHYGLTLLYYTPKDVDIKNNKVTGYELVNDSWVKQRTDIPAFNDVATLCFKHKEIVNYLRQVSTLSNNLIGSKAKQYKILKESGTFKHLVIPYITTNQPERIINFLQTHPTVILKPRTGMRGTNIYQVSLQENDQFHVVHETHEETYSHEGFYHFLYEIISESKYICQKYIHTRDENDKPFDVRIRLEKNIHGQWERVINLVRIASNQKIVANVAQGGYVSGLKPFLKLNYPDNWRKIENKIIEIGDQLPSHIEEQIDKNLSSLGIDIGICPKGNLYLFEVNTSPGSEFALGEIALIKSGYYSYCIDKLHQKSKKISSL